MKMFKKNIFIALFSALAIILTACGSSMSNEDVVKKFYENTKNMKSADIVADTTTEMSVLNQKMTINSVMDGSVILDPVAMKMTLKTKMENQSVNMQLYFKDNVMYMEDPTSAGKWVKTTDDSIVSSIKKQQEGLTSDAMLELFKEVSKDTTVAEKDGKYVLTYKGDGSGYTDILKKSLEATVTDNAMLTQLTQNMTFKSVEVIYVVDKNTLLPIETTTNYEMEVSIQGQSVNMKVNGKTTFSNINKVSEITLPDEVKNAEELEM